MASGVNEGPSGSKCVRKACGTVSDKMQFFKFNKLESLLAHALM
jgi:hypothetical protein